MGWWEDLLQWLSDFVNGLVGWIVQLISDIEAWFAYQIYLIKQEIAKLLASPVGFLALLALIFLGVIVGSAFFIAAQQIGLIALMGTMQIAFTEGLGSFLELIGFRELLAINKIAIIFFDEYRNLVSQIANAFSGLSEELGLGTNIINTFLRNARNIVYSAYTLAGADTDTKELAYFTQVQEFYQGIEANFQRYYKDPGQVLDDIDQNIVYPHSQMQDEAISIVYDTINGLVEDAQTFAENLQTLKSDFDTAFFDLANTVDAQNIQWYEDFSKDWDILFDDTINPFIDKVSKSFDIINASIQRELEAREKLEIRLEKSVDYLAELYDLSDTEKEQQLLKLLSMVGEGYSFISVPLAIMGINNFNKYKEKIPKKKELIIEKVSISDLRKKIERKTIEKPVINNTWFVGE